MQFFDGSMRPGDRTANAGAKFYAAREPHQPLITYPAGSSEDGSTDETYGPPCVEIAGVQVYVYVRDGILVLSVHYDGADTSNDSPFALYGDGDDCIPTVVKAGSPDPVFVTIPDNAIDPADGRALRKVDALRPGDWVIPDWVYDG